eukprot:jgi/Tetstr1/424559/TSEL_015085.t1
MEASKLTDLPKMRNSDREALLKVFVRAPSSRSYRVWTDEEEANLLRGVSEFGVGNWEAIRLRPELCLSQRSALQLKDKWRNLVKYGHVSVRDFSAAATPPATPDKKRKRCSEGGESAAGSGECGPSTPNKKDGGLRTSRRPDSPASSTGVFQPETPTRTDAAACDSSQRSDLSHSPPSPLAQAEARLERAVDILRVALDIQADANHALTALLEAVSATRHGARPDDQAALRSASFVAELAQEKALKARSLWEHAQREVAAEKGAAYIAASFANLLESEDTACSATAFALPLELHPCDNHHSTPGSDCLDDGFIDLLDGGFDSCQLPEDEVADFEMLSSTDCC